jgi:hypothetical protein
MVLMLLLLRATRFVFHDVGLRENNVGDADEAATTAEGAAIERGGEGEVRI